MNGISVTKMDVFLHCQSSQSIAVINECQMASIGPSTINVVCFCLLNLEGVPLSDTSEEKGFVSLEAGKHTKV